MNKRVVHERARDRHRASTGAVGAQSDARRGLGSRRRPNDGEGWGRESSHKDRSVEDWARVCWGESPCIRCDRLLGGVAGKGGSRSARAASPQRLRNDGRQNKADMNLFRVLPHFFCTLSLAQTSSCTSLHDTISLRQGVARTPRVLKQSEDLSARPAGWVGFARLFRTAASHALCGPGPEVILIRSPPPVLKYILDEVHSITKISPTPPARFCRLLEPLSRAKGSRCAAEENMIVPPR